MHIVHPFILRDGQRTRARDNDIRRTQVISYIIEVIPHCVNHDVLGLFPLCIEVNSAVKACPTVGIGVALDVQHHRAVGSIELQTLTFGGRGVET